MGRLLSVIMIMISGTVCSQQIEVDIVQIKLNRVYFAAGAEAGIDAGANIVIDCGDRDPYIGAIEYSGPGISYSEPIPALDSVAMDSQCVARITIAAVDSQATVIVGTDLPPSYFDPEHEPLFGRTADTLVMNLVDSARAIGNSATLHLPQGVCFSDGIPFNAEELRRFFVHLKESSRSYLVRYFFSKLLPIDSGGMQIMDGSILRMEFYHPFPRVCYFLSHPDFAVYSGLGRGTGALVDVSDPESRSDSRTFVPNEHFRGTPPAFSELIVRNYDQQYRMMFAFENGELDGVVGFGFESDLAGLYEARSLYPKTVAIVSGIDRELFSGGLFLTSLYYCFNPSLGHLYFQYGDIKPVNRWLPPAAEDLPGSRYYPFDILKGKQLFGSIQSDIDSALLAYDHPLLYNTVDYLADIAAREGMTATNRRYFSDFAFDVRVAFFPSSDHIMPFSLFSAILELNDQNSALPSEDRLDRPGWDDAGRGSQMYDIRNRRTFFSRAEETLFSEAGFFPLYRPYIYAVPASGVGGFAFDFYGYPVLHDIRKLRRGSSGPSGEDK